MKGFPEVNDTCRSRYIYTLANAVWGTVCIKELGTLPNATIY